MIGHRKTAAALRTGAAMLMFAAATTQPAAAAQGTQGGGTEKTAPAKRVFNYFLPRTELTIAVAQQLTACPAKGENAAVDTTITITPTRDADPAGHVRLDAGSGTLAKRTVKLELNPDGTLAAFNSESEGQGGPVLTSIAKLAFEVAKVGILGASGSLACTQDTLDTFAAIKKVGEQIAQLEATIIAGGGDTAATALETSLENYAPPVTSLPATLDNAAATNLFKAYLPAIDYRPWFVTAPQGGPGSRVLWTDISFPGAYGFLVTITPDRALYNALHVGDGFRLDATPTPNLVYRLAVPASVVIAPCADAGEENCPVDTSDEGKLASFRGNVQMTQLSGLYAIRTGRGGLFGTRAATAKFDANGVPSALEYGSTSASADLAGLVDTAREGVGTLRDTELNKLKRQIELEEARQKLGELRSAATTDDK